MKRILQGRRRILSVLVALTLTLVAAGAPSTAAAADGVEPHSVCEPTGWFKVGTWIGDIYSPWFYGDQYTKVQYKVFSGDTYKRILRNCGVQFTHPGQAGQYRSHYCKAGKACYYSKWSNVSKGCTISDKTKMYGYNYWRGVCNFWNAP